MSSPVAIQRNTSFTVFNAALGDVSSQVFALFAKPIEPHWVTLLAQWGGESGQIDVYFGVLGPAPVQTLANTNSATMAASIVWGPSAGHVTAPNVQLNLQAPAAQFVQFIVTGVSGSPPPGVSASAIVM